MEIRTATGKLKSKDVLYDEAIELMVEALENLDDDDALNIGNMYRDNEGESTLYCMDESSINDALEGVGPWDIIQLEVSTRYDYFTWDGYDLSTTDDVWEDIDLEDGLAPAILQDEFSHWDLPSQIKDVYYAYMEALEELDNINSTQREIIDLVARYTNCEADATDLLVMLDRLARSEDVFVEE